ncbi:MAG: hypothetical protein WD894_11480 [Pirellulales bacterium]
MRHKPDITYFLFIALSLAAATAPASEFITIGSGSAFDLSADGSVVVASGGYWTREHGLVPLPGATAVSDDGSVFAGSTMEGGPYRWTAETGFEPLGPPPGFPFASAVARSVSGDGNVVGGDLTEPGDNAWIWTEEDGYRWLGPGARTVNALSTDGRVAVGNGGSNSSGFSSAFRWTHENGLVRLPTLGGGVFPSVAFDLSPNGSVVVGDSPSAALPEGRREAFRWTAEGGIKGLGALPSASSSQAFGVSADSLVAVGTSRVGGFRAFVWDEVHGIRDFEKVLRENYGLTHVTLGSDARASRISADRRTIAGSGSGGAWVAYLDHPIGPPLPEFGDYNADGKVGQPDLNLALGKWGKDLPDFAYPWINDLPVGAVGQSELSAVVLNWPANAGPLDLSLGVSNGALTANYDLKTNAAIIDYSGSSPAATVRQQILSGRGGAGFGKPWNGPGITSSTAATANATEPESRSVGYAENGAMPLGPYTTFRGQPVDNTSILMAFTRTGDANLDGIVNDDDVTIVGATYAPGVAQPSWSLGDFDYNGFVDDDDVTLLGVFYDPSAQPLIAAAPAGTAAVAAVPEPASWMLLASSLVALSLFAIRRCYLSRSERAT